MVIFFLSIILIDTPFSIFTGNMNDEKYFILSWFYERQRKNKKDTPAQS